MPTLSTPFQLDCALMAGAVYVSNRDVINQLPVPPGWVLLHINPCLLADLRLQALPTGRK